MNVACPTCGKPAEYTPANRFRPFCCERCRSIDLGAWASEAYSIPAPEDPPGEADPEPGGR